MTVHTHSAHAQHTTVYTLPYTYDGFYIHFSPTTVHTGAPMHDGLGRAALVRRFKY
eukprot:COSAG01_NODE_67556_length_266_cov_1.868263_1_plen_55_part_01